MTVTQLIKELSKVKNQEAEVLMSSDMEGNRFGRFGELHAPKDLVFIEPVEDHGSYKHKLGIELGSSRSRSDEYLSDGKPCIVLFPDM